MWTFLVLCVKGGGEWIDPEKGPLQRELEMWGVRQPSDGEPGSEATDHAGK